MSSTTGEVVNFASDFRVRRTKTVTGDGIQHVRLDIGTGSAESQVTSLNGLPVTIIGSSSTPNSILAYSETTALGSATLATVVTYTATGSDVVSRVIVSGEDYAKFTIVLNTVIKATARSGPDRNVFFDLNLGLTVGDVLDVKVEHFHTGDTLDFEGSIIGFT